MILLCFVNLLVTDEHIGKGVDCQHIFFRVMRIDGTVQGMAPIKPRNCSPPPLLLPRTRFQIDPRHLIPHGKYKRNRQDHTEHPECRLAK